jgi:hypothetical protein
MSVSVIGTPKARLNPNGLFAGLKFYVTTRGRYIDSEDLALYTANGAIALPCTRVRNSHDPSTAFLPPPAGVTHVIFSAISPVEASWLHAIVLRTDPSIQCVTTVWPIASEALQKLANPAFYRPRLLLQEAAPVAPAPIPAAALPAPIPAAALPAPIAFCKCIFIDRRALVRHIRTVAMQTQ